MNRKKILKYYKISYSVDNARYKTHNFKQICAYELLVRNMTFMQIFPLNRKQKCLKEMEVQCK